ncbi:unnamed protein product [Schistocephalus solidus]|uniref:Ion_trans domain-containing protein n=1 Tax=Schistocephalus solidus TaxID=70667 RepID=A0A183SQZ7_SCHSO|nr:unnamed protein product [Schistocephalus solidus]
MSEAPAWRDTKAVELIQLNPNYLRGQLDCSLFICSLPIQHIVEHEWWNDFNANALVIIISFFCPFLVATRLFSFAPVAVEAQSAFLPSSSTPSLFYVAFVFLYAYALTVGLRADYVSIFEILIVVELISFLTETVVEVIPMLEDSCHYASFVHNVIELPAFYKYDLILNALNVVAILCGLGRLVPFEVIKSLYAVSFLLHSFRFFKFYYFYSNLGPKLAMIERMLGEMMEFLAFLLVFLLATGVAMEALLYISRTHFKLAVLQDIFTIQFYRIFGDNNLELAEGKKDGCNVPDGIDCPVSNPLVPRLLDLFMLIVVTLLMNLLIAIFSNVYEQFESESRELWKRARCHLLFEFKSKSIHPMPFNIIERFIQLSIATFRLCQPARHKNVKVAEQTTLTPTEPLPDEQADLIQKRLEEAVRKSQEDRMDTYLKTIRQKALPRLLQIMETCAEDTATNMVESLTCRNDRQGHTKIFQQIIGRAAEYDEGISGDGGGGVVVVVV